MPTSKFTFRSRVARRVFSTFALAALLPALVTSSLTYYAVEQQLKNKSLDQLRAESKNFSYNILQQMQLARDLLSQYEASPAAGTANSTDSYFRQISVETRTNVANGVNGVNGVNGTMVPSAAGSIASFEVRKTGAESSVWMTVERSASEIVRAEIDPLFLWGSPEFFPATVNLCVLDNSGGTIFCPQRPGEQALETLRRSLDNSSVGEMRWEEYGEAYLAGYFTLPLQFDFAAEGWTIAAMQAEADALAPMTGFRLMFPPAIGLSVLLTIWISLRQVRRRLAPLQVLTAATRKIAAGDFSTKVDVKGDDEFHSLAQSLSQMSNDLGRQFHTLQALSDLDQKILASNDVQPVVESLARRMLEVFNCEYAAITVLRKDAKEVARLTWCGKQGMAFDRIELPEDDLPPKSAVPQTLSAAESNAAYLLPLKKSGAAMFQVLPVMHEEHIVGIITLGYDSGDWLYPSEIATLRDFGDRLSVALQTIDRAEQIYRRAYYDSLTRLPNRQLLKDRLHRSIGEAIANGQTNALLFIDLDNFKNVNDSEGHSVGDKLLRLAAQRLRRCIEGADTIARLGGDEFTVILSDLTSPHEASKAAEDIIEALSEPFEIETMEHFLSASIGITMIPTDGASVDELLRNADTAMYRAKDLGRGRAVFFEDRMNKEAEERVSLAADLRRAIERDELELHYQPKIDLKTGEVAGAEGLLRWMHPDHGLLAPDSFIPVAEETGLIVNIGEWVIFEAARQLATWQENGYLDSISVNVSYRQIRDSDLQTVVKRAIHNSAIRPECLELEITESIMAEDKEVALEVLTALRSLGVRVAIDDFGTGYSSFSYLTDMSFDTIKIDKAFLDDIPANNEKTAVIAGIIQMGTLLGKDLVAEGVETNEQAATLIKLECSHAQGYLYSKPLSVTDFEEFLTQQGARKLA